MHHCTLPPEPPWHLRHPEHRIQKCGGHQHEAGLKDTKPLADEEEGPAVITNMKKKRKHAPTPQAELLPDQLHDDNEALKRCKQEFIEEDHAAFQQVVSAVEAAAQCSICSDTTKQANTLSTCGHTFCRSCIEEALRSKGCCPECMLPAWRRDIRDSRRLNGVMVAVGVMK
jgi:hypothetical protein